MDWVCFVIVLSASVVSCRPEDGADGGDKAFISGDGAEFSRRAAEFSRGAYLVEDRGDFTNPTNDPVTEERTVTSEQRKDGIHHKVTITKKIRVPYTVHVEKRIPKIIEVPVDKPFNVYVPKPYPVIVEKKVPFEIKVLQPQPYTVEKKVPYPVKVLVDKPYTLHVPKPYPVEVEKKFEFQVEKKVPFEVKVPVERRYPVHVIVEKEVKFPVEKKVPVPVKVPHDKPIPIHVTKHVPVHVDKLVPYTMEKVVTYPVEVPFRIPIKVHYEDGGSMDDLYSNSNSTPDLQNIEWSEAMTSASKAIRSFEQNQFRSPMRQGFSVPHNRGPYSKNPFYLSSPSKGYPRHQNHQNFRTPTKLHSVHPPQPTYEVNEVQSPSDNLQAAPFLSKPDSEVIVPQLLIGSPPQQSTNMLLSQAALAAIVHPRGNGSNISYKTPHFKNDGPSFTISQTVQHNPATQLRTSAPPHNFHYNSGNDQQFQGVNQWKPNPSSTYFGIQTGDQNGKSENKLSQTQSSQVPSATYFRPAPQTLSTGERVSFPKLIVPTAEGLKNHQTLMHQNAVRQHQVEQSTRHQRTNTKTQSGQSTTLESLAGRNQQHPQAQKLSPAISNPQPPAASAQQHQEPSGTPNQNAGPNISSSYVGSKTLLGNQELVYSSSIQHNPMPQQ